MNPSDSVFSPEMLGRRRHERFAFEKPGILRLERVRGGLYLITVLDLSKSGLRVNSPRAVPRETRVEVRCLGRTVSGVVRFAREVGPREFHLGIEADRAEADGTVWSAGTLDLTALFRLSHS